jgi:hypothetical protein
MTTLLLAALLLQDSPEEVLHKIQDTIEKATSAKAEYKVEGIPFSKDASVTAQVTGSIEIKQSNKVRFTGTMSVGDQKSETEIRSDGRRRFTVTGDAVSVPVETPKAFETEARSALTWMSVIGIWAQAGKPGEADPNDLYEITELKSGADDAGFKTLEYVLVRKPREGLPPKVRVWYDPKTYLVAKRTLTSQREGVTAVITETLSKVVLNPDLSDDLFHVPQEK